MLNPGALNRKVSFSQPQTGISSYGAPTKVYVHAFFMWMSREPAGSGIEQPINSRMVVPTRYIYRGHYKSAIDETMQIVDAGVKYNILEINPSDDKISIEVTAEKLTE